jgi:hypothetical protein
MWPLPSRLPPPSRVSPLLSCGNHHFPSPSPPLPSLSEVSTCIEGRTPIAASSTLPIIELHPCPSVSPHSKTAGDKIVAANERWSAAAQNRANTTAEFVCAVRVCQRS